MVVAYNLTHDWTWTGHGMGYTDSYLNTKEGMMKQDMTLETEQDKEEDKMIIRPSDESTAGS